VVIEAGPFNPISKCPQLPPHKPKDVRDLHPNDIKVVMALGDSITAGFGLMGLDGLLTLDEFRGYSYAMGGDTDQITLANFFAHYTPDVVGASLGHHLFELPYMDYWEQDHLNAAQSNAGVDTLLYQVDHLRRQLERLPNVDLEKDWKFLNLLIGANDACPLCWEWDRPTVKQAGDSFEGYLTQVIQAVYKKIPRVFFNIMPMFNVSQVYYLGLNVSYCSDFHDVTPFECTCAFDTDSANRVYLDSVLQEFNARIFKLTGQWKAKQLPDFTVQTQNFTVNLKIPNLSYLSTLDCFHPSLLGHQKMAVTIWNSIISPDGKKPTHFNVNEKLICPTKDTLLYA